jgi:hypothetical protein
MTTRETRESLWTPPVVLGYGLALVGAACLVWGYVSDKLTGPGLVMGIAMVAGGMWMVDPARSAGFFDRAQAAADVVLPGIARAGRRDSDPVAVPEEFAARALARPPISAAVAWDASRIDWQAGKEAQRRRLTTAKPKPKKAAAKKTTTRKRREP